jgi:hypothetical protein
MVNGFVSGSQSRNLPSLRKLHNVQQPVADTASESGT